MKKIDKLILTSFLGPFVLTLVVVVFILLTQHMLKYFDDIIGKDLGWDVVGTLLFYFGIYMTPVATPLAILLSSLITFGNLGEHFELTAIKSLGISLVRSLLPIFAFVLLLTLVAFYANNTLAPKAALEAYSLLYDIKQKKPALDLREGTFYSSIPDISIKVNKKFPDGQTLKDVIIYDHRGKTGNKEVTIADSGKMYTILNDQYLKLELFKGYNYKEGNGGDDLSGQANPNKQTLSKTKFDKTQIVFDLSSFGLNRTDKKWFQGNRIMRNMSELQMDMDSLGGGLTNQRLSIFSTTRDQMFAYHNKKDTIELPPQLAAYKEKKDSLERLKEKDKKELPGIVKVNEPANSFLNFKIGKEVYANDSIYQLTISKSDSLFGAPWTKPEISSALAQARSIKSHLLNFSNQEASLESEYKVFQIQWHKILMNSFACIVMFLIGAPLGAIIKRGGLGMPVLASIIFFIIWYLFTVMGEKWAKQGLISVPVGIWAGNVFLLIIGLLFLRQARADARLFEADFYRVVWDKLKIWLRAHKLIAPTEG